MPQIRETGDNYYIMEYLTEYTPLYKVFSSFNLQLQNIILNKIHEKLTSLHNSSYIYLSKERYCKSLFFETYDKLKGRYNEIKEIIDEYFYIKTVNNVDIISITVALEKIKKIIENFIISQKEYKYVPIHGDCQFNNILINRTTTDIVFIDPRGYFGYESLYGLAEYDFAKVKFALSGYDNFDNSEITKLDIEDTNIRVEIEQLTNDFFKKDSIETVLAISIWLGNASSFKISKEKCVYSFFIAMYYASIYL
jgi:hypothetical protein